VNRLLKEGERDRIVAFLEAYAQLTARDRQRLLDDAKAIRAGRMPPAYQHMMNREWNRTHGQESRDRTGSAPPSSNAGS
jgi:hypothetical protein